MSAKPEQLVSPQFLTTTLVSYYTAPAQKRVIISKMTVANVTTNVKAVYIHVVPAGDSPNTGNLLLAEKLLDGKQSFPVYQLEGQILAAGDTIQAKADDNSAVSFMVSGVTVV